MSIFTPEIISLLLLLGSVAGLLAGLLGIGGGIILVPLFLWAFPLAGIDPEVVVHTAFGTSLAIIIPTAVSSTLGHRKRGNVEWHQVVWLAAGGMVGAFAGGALAATLSGVWLRGLFGVMQILVALKLYLFHPHLPPERSGRVPPSQLLAVGLAGGTFSAFFGVGGGVIAVPLMVLVLQLPIHLAVGNSSALIVFSSFAGTLSYILNGYNLPNLPPFSLGYVNQLVALAVAPFTILFARLGVRLASRVSHARLVKIFSLVLLLVGLRMIFKSILS